jgi:hypothetical protein
MTWFLKDDPVAAPTPPPVFAEGQVPSRSQQFGAAVRKAQIEGNRWFATSTVENDLQQEMIEALGGVETIAPNNREEMRQFRQDNTGWLLERAERLQRMAPEAIGSLPINRAQFDAEVTARLRRERDEAAAILARGNNPWVQFSGELVGSLDWYDVAALPIDAPLAAGAKLTAYVGKQFLLGSALSVPGVAATQAQGERLGFDAGNPVAQVAAGGVLQGALAGVIGGALRIPEYLATRYAAEKAARPEGMSPVTLEAQTDAAEEALEVGRVPPAPAATGGQFAAVEAQYGLPPGYLDRTYMIESGGNPNAQNPNSSAGGGFQFIDSTARAYGLTDKFDLNAAADAAARLASDNRDILRKALGREPTAAELYLAHQQGGGGAARLLSNPDALAVDIVGAEAVRLNGGSAGMTARQFAGLWINKFNNAPTGTGSTYTGTPGRRSPRGTLSNEVSTPAGTRVQVEYQVVDMGSLRAASGELQPRDRSRAASDEQIAKIAARLDPALLMPGPLSDRGAPLVGPDGIIESGNGRVQGLARAAERNPEAYAAYVQAIRDEGFDVPDGMTRPVLIARRTTDLDQAGRIQVIRESNTSAIGRMSATEQARFDADGMTQPVFDAYRPGKTLGSLENAGFIQRFMAGMTPEERAPLIQANGRLSADGLKRIASALFARAFDAKDLLTLVAETESRAITRLVTMLENLAPDWAYFRSMVEAGYVRTEFDITAPLTEAVRIIANARAAARDGQSVIAAVRDRLAQTDMFTPRDPMIEAIIDVFYKGDRARGIETSEEILKRYAASAAAMGRADAADLADDAVSPVDVLRRAITDEEGGSPYAPLPARADPEAVPDVTDIAAAVETFDPARFTDGTASPEVQAADDALLDELAAQEGPFGPVYDGFTNDPEGAIAKIMAEGKGEVPDAFVHPELGPIAFVYGKLHPDNPKKDYGLIHILQKHGQEMLQSLPDAMRRGIAKPPANGRVYLDTPDTPMRRTVVKLEWNDAEKRWVASSHLRPSEGAGQVRTTDVPPASASPRVPDATPQADNTLPKAAEQDAPDSATAIAEARATLAPDDILTIGEGDQAVRITVADALAALDADRKLEEVMEACKIGRARA